jgi:hypothetical protein
MGQSVNLIRYGGNAVLNTLKVNLTSSNSATRVVVVDDSGRFYYTSSYSGGGGGTGTVTSVSVVNANGLNGTVANATTTPAITLSTTVTGLLKGNGTAISAASAGTDYITSTAGTASWAQNSISSSYAETSSLPLRGIVTASAANTTITFTKGDGSTFDVTVAQSGSVATASYALFAVLAATASYIDPANLNLTLFQIATGSVTASVNVNPTNLFLIKSGSTQYFNISSSGNADLYSNLFIVRNFTTQRPVLIVSQSIVQIQTQSSIPTGTISAGSIWFTSSSFYVGLE